MTGLRLDGWFFIGLGLLITLVRLPEVWRLLTGFEWALLAMLMAGPPVVLSRYLKIAQGTEEQVRNVGVSIALGGYVPLWFAFRSAERMAHG